MLLSTYRTARLAVVVDDALREARVVVLRAYGALGKHARDAAAVPHGGGGRRRVIDGLVDRLALDGSMVHELRVLSGSWLPRCFTGRARIRRGSRRGGRWGRGALLRWWSCRLSGGCALIRRTSGRDLVRSARRRFLLFRQQRRDDPERGLVVRCGFARSGVAVCGRGCRALLETRVPDRGGKTRDANQTHENGCREHKAAVLLACLNAAPVPPQNRRLPNELLVIW